MTIQKFEVPDWIRSVLICDPTDIWGNVVGMGLGELTRVLSFAKRYDGRGTIYHLDGFEHGLSGCATLTLGTNAAVTLTSDESRSGGLAAKLTGGSTSGGYAAIFYRLPLPPLSKIGVEATVRLNTSVSAIRIYIRYHDGVNSHYGYLRYDTALDEWEYYDSIENFVAFLTNKALLETPYMFHLMKFVIDPATDKYVRALVSGQEVDMSAYSLYSFAYATNPRLEVYFYAYSESGVNGVAILDNLIITTNEPS